MPKPTKGPRLGGTPTHQRIILANLATQLFEHGRITTTETRAKRVQPLAEKLINKAKRGDLHARRLVMQTVTDPTVVHVLFTQIAPALAKREGGYTRITKIGNRKGDNAPMAMIEVITEEVQAKAKKTAPSKRPVKAAEEAAATATVDEALKAADEIADEAADSVEETEVAAEPEAAEAADEAETVADEAAATDQAVADEAETAEEK